MQRTPLHVHTIPPGAAVSILWESADIENGNRFPGAGKELILVRNRGQEVVAFLVESASPPGTARIPVGPGQVTAFWVPDTNRWAQRDAHIYLSSQSSFLEFAVLEIG